MDSTQTMTKKRLAVGAFSLAGLLLIGFVTIAVNDRPYWWRPCQFVRISVDDATGLKTRSPIRSLGLEIGFLDSVELAGTKVDLGICITSQVEILPSTRAYIRSEGFLGDKFVELKPVKYTGQVKYPEKMEKRLLDRQLDKPAEKQPSEKSPTQNPKESGQVIQERSGKELASIEKSSKYSEYSSHFSQSAHSNLIQIWVPIVQFISSQVLSEANAAEKAFAADPEDPKADAAKEGATRKNHKQIPMGENSQDFQQLVNRVDSLVHEMTGLTSNLKNALDPEDLKSTMRQLNRTLESASKTLSPDGGLNQTAQRTLAKLEDAIEQMRDQLTRINQGKGSIGMLLNDEKFAEETLAALKNVNQLLSRVGGVRFVIDLGTEKFRGFSNGRSWVRLGIWPKPYRYYLLGISIDPRGKTTEITTETTTTVGGVSNKVEQRVVRVEPAGILFTGIIGYILNERFDFSAGILHGEGNLSGAYRFGPVGREGDAEFRTDLYTTGTAGSASSMIESRIQLLYRPYSIFYAKAGIEGFRKINGVLPFLIGAGISFDDEDIKLLFTFLR